MDVKFFKEAVTWRAVKFLATVGICAGAIFFLAAFVTGRSDETVSKRVNIAMRAIGHELLLHAGDSISVVPPVIERPNGVFMLEFENEFVFQPDSLVTIVQRVIDKTGLSRYTVTVHKCDDPAIVYGFEINPPLNNIKSCRGRHQPQACYKIEIAFADFPGKGSSNSPFAMIVGGVLFLLAVVLISKNFAAPKSKPVEEQISSLQDAGSPGVRIGKFIFDMHQSLKIDGETIPLTDKECKILTVLNKNIGALTRRDDLIEEVWTDEGVITGRSLDMFISKLRKKLSGDPELRITNVHGKGYRLEIVSDSIGS